jgi:hypothetical protein
MPQSSRLVVVAVAAGLLIVLTAPGSDAASPLRATPTAGIGGDQTWPFGPEPNCSVREFLRPGCEYDAREFLSDAERRQFESLYPHFGEVQEKKGAKAEVDADGLRRPVPGRTYGGYEYCEGCPPEGEGPPSAEQLRFQSVVQSEFDHPTLKMSRATLKITVPLDGAKHLDWLPNEQRSQMPYRNPVEMRRVLGRLARIGLKWAALGGTRVYLYRFVLVARYREGWVCPADKRMSQLMVD